MEIVLGTFCKEGQGWNGAEQGSAYVVLSHSAASNPLSIDLPMLAKDKSNSLISDMPTVRGAEATPEALLGHRNEIG